MEKEKKEKSLLFDFLNSIMEKKSYVLDDHPDGLKDYVPYVINRGVSLFPDTVMYANDMNMMPHLSPKMQYDYYYHGIRKGRRFSKWPKRMAWSEDVKMIMKLYKYNHKRAEEILDILTKEELADLRRQHEGL